VASSSAPPSERSGWRVLLIPMAAAAGLMLALLFAGGGIGGGGEGPPGSSYVAGKSGAKAAYLLLGKLGHRVERRADPMGDLRRVRLAFLLNPETRLSRMDLVGLVEWVEAGGTLVYGVASFEPDADLLRGGLELPSFRTRISERTEVSLEGDWAPARKLSLRLRLDPSNASEHATTNLAREGRRTWAFVTTRGRGRIYVLDARAFSNDGLKEADNAVFLASLAARHAPAPDATVVFDEFVHGFGDPVSLLSIGAWPLRLSLGVTALALLLYALGAGRRLGRVGPEAIPPRRASIEQIEALASFYAARNDRAGALAGLAAWAGAPPPAAADKDAAFVSAAHSLVQAARTRKKELTRWR
jgi:hypothetical protein